MDELEEKKRYFSPLITISAFAMEDVLCSSLDFGNDENEGDWDDEFAEPIS